MFYVCQHIFCNMVQLDGVTVCGSYIPQIRLQVYAQTLNTLRFCIHSGRQYTVQIRVEKPWGLALFPSSLPEEEATVPPITKYGNTTHKSKLA